MVNPGSQPLRIKAVAASASYPAHKWIESYERGFRYDRYDLVIRSVTDLASTVRLLDRLDMR
jgi:hypothetical protein